MIDNDDIYVYLVKLPEGINEMVAPSGLGYTVYIDERLTRSAQVEAYEHAVSHIATNDFGCGKDVDSLETIARNGEKDVYR